MGASQSTNGPSAVPSVAAAKTSYYELLGVERHATDEEYVTPRLQPSER